MSVHITLDQDLLKASNWPPAIAKGLPFMIQAALVKGSEKATKALSIQLKKKLDRPTTRTLKSPAFSPRRPSTNKLQITMFIKGAGPLDADEGERGSAGNYLQPLIKGGGRSKKRSEHRLGRYIIPTEAEDTVIPGLKYNKYGGQYVRRTKASSVRYS